MVNEEALLDVMHLSENFSTWSELVHAIEWMKRALMLKSFSESSINQVNPAEADIIAKRTLFKIAQDSSFGDINAVRKDNIKLDLVVDKKGISSRRRKVSSLKSS